MASLMPCLRSFPSSAIFSSSGRSDSRIHSRSRLLPQRLSPLYPRTRFRKRVVVSVASGGTDPENVRISSSDPPSRPDSLDLTRQESFSFVRNASKYDWAEYDRALEKLEVDRAVSILEALESKPIASEATLEQKELHLEWQSAASTSGQLTIPSPIQDKLFRVLDIGLAAENIADVSRAYSFLQSQRLLANFGRFNPTASSIPRKVTPQVLKDYSGLDVSKLSPQKWGISSSVGPLVVFGVFCSLMNNDLPVRPLVASILAFFLIDSIVLGGTSYGQLRSLIPNYKRRILVHEAGHILSAYLLGCPIRGVILNSWDAIKMGIKGQAGTQFWDDTLETELIAGRLTMSSIDRYCIVLFSGIAAEAMEYGQAEGGEGDENLFKAVIGSLQPSWSTPKMANQARWSVLQAYLLLTKYKNAHATIVNELEKNSSLGVIVQAIEKAIVKEQ